MREHIVEGVHILKVYTNYTITDMNIRADIKVIARQALTTTVCDTLLNANFTRWEEHKQSVPPSWLPLNWRRNTQIQMYWLWKWLENTIIAPFQHERTNFYSICYFGSQIRFAHFMIMLGEELPSLPLLTARHWFFIIQIFEQLSCSVKQCCHEILHYVEIFFIFQDFWATCGLPWKTEGPLNSLYWIYIFSMIQNFEQLAHALKNRVCPEIFHCIEIFLSFRIFEELALALKIEFVMKCFAVFHILFTFRMFQQLLLALKNRVCTENFHCIEITIFEELALVLKTKFFLKYFTVLNIVFTFRIF